MLRLLHLCDTLFPIGSFGYSDGLEAAGIQDAAGLRAWLDACLDETLGRLEVPIVRHAWRLFVDEDWEALARLDHEATAIRPSASARKSNRSMGLRLLTTWEALYPDARVARALALANSRELGPTLPVAFAGASVSVGIECRQAVEAFAYTRLASTVSAAMRLMPIGQTEAHTLLARALDRVPSIGDRAIASEGDPESFSPLVDIATMRHQYMHSRLFRS